MELVHFREPDPVRPPLQPAGRLLGRQLPVVREVGQQLPVVQQVGHQGEDHPGGHLRDRHHLGRHRHPLPQPRLLAALQAELR